MKDRRVLVRLKLLGTKVVEVTRIPDFDMTENGPGGGIMTVHFGGPDQVKDLGSGNDVTKVS